MPNGPIEYAVNSVDRYCNSHAEMRSIYAAPKMLAGVDRLGITKASLRGLADWLEGQEAYNVATDSLGDDGPRSHAEAILIGLREKILNEAKQ